ncbi:MAG: DUF4194 domain-containing protein [Mariprofundaceae bacterium]|nr:DUF4194 domain-containing protein [Mariprofundaceae bacterium]
MSDIETSNSAHPDLLEMLSGQVERAHAPEQQKPDEVTSQVIPAYKQQDESGAGEAPGELLPETRRALVALLRHGVIMAANKRLLFDTLCRDQMRIQTRLADMYLHMLLDEKAGLAMLLQQDGVETDEEEEISTLISRRTLTLFDTLLLLVLRKHYQEREAAGEQRVMIDIDRIEIALHPFLPLTNSSRMDRRRLNGALANMKERRVLAAVRGEEERFEITPVIRYVVNAAFLEQMLDEYRALAGEATSGSAVEDEHA